MVPQTRHFALVIAVVAGLSGCVAAADSVRSREPADANLSDPKDLVSAGSSTSSVGPGEPCSPLELAGTAGAFAQGQAGAESRCGEPDWQPTRSLTGQIVNQAEVIGSPGDLAIIGSYLVLLDGFAGPSFHVFRISDGKLLKSLGRKGQGPGEFIGPASIDPAPNTESKFWIFDITVCRLTHVNLDDVLADERDLGKRVLLLVSPGAPTHPIWINENLTISPGFFVQGRFGHYGADGEILRTVGDTPPGDDRIPAVVRQHAYTGTFQPNAQRTLFALATRYADRIEIYAADGTLIAVAQRPVGFEPVYELAERSGRPVLGGRSDTRFGYIDVTTTDGRIFAVFSGRTRGEGEANFGNVVHVFDWNGCLLEVLELDSKVVDIAVDANSWTLYAARHLPTPAVLRFRLDSM